MNIRKAWGRKLDHDAAFLFKKGLIFNIYFINLEISYELLHVSPRFEADSTWLY